MARRSVKQVMVEANEIGALIYEHALSRGVLTAYMAAQFACARMFEALYIEGRDVEAFKADFRTVASMLPDERRRAIVGASVTVVPELTEPSENLEAVLHAIINYSGDNGTRAAIVALAAARSARLVIEGLRAERFTDDEWAKIEEGGRQLAECVQVGVDYGTAEARVPNAKGGDA